MKCFVGKRKNVSFYICILISKSIQKRNPINRLLFLYHLVNFDSALVTFVKAPAAFDVFAASLCCTFVVFVCECEKLVKNNNVG